MSPLGPIEASETAKVKAAETYGLAPPEWMQVIEGWLTVLEMIDAKHHPSSLPSDASYATAVEILERRPDLGDRRVLQQKRMDWLRERAPVIDRLTDIAALFPRPIVVGREQVEAAR